MFIFADADLKFDQPQAEVVFDRDKLRSQGVDLSQAGREIGAKCIDKHEDEVLWPADQFNQLLLDMSFKDAKGLPP